MSNILILHPNYPAQFRLHSQFLLSAGHRVVFVAQSASERPLPGLKLYVLQHQLSREYLEQACSDESDRVTMRSMQYNQMFLHLDSQGFVPDLVISHSGWGCAQTVKDCWKNARLISYLEWWFDPDSALVSFEASPDFQTIHRHMQPKLDVRNQLLLKEAEQADSCVSPTYWQRSQFPLSLQARCSVIHEGVDLSEFAPRGIPDHSKRVMTYGTRGLEPMRGFQQFIQQLELALPISPEWTVSIAGEDRCFYSPSRPPKAFKTYGDWAASLLESSNLASRVQFVNRLPATRYKAWLRVSSLHIYLSQPFVCSWSLVEAMAMGCLLVVSDVPPVREVVPDNAAFFVDHRRPDWLQPILQAVESDPAGCLRLRSAARRAALRFCRHRSVQSWKRLVGQLLPT